MCFLYFSKVWWVQNNEGVTFVVVPPNHTFTQVAPFVKKVHYFANKMNLVVITLFDVPFMHWLELLLQSLYAFFEHNPKKIAKISKAN
jgi:hypothetical protein